MPDGAPPPGASAQPVVIPSALPGGVSAQPTAAVDVGESLRALVGIGTTDSLGHASFWLPAVNVPLAVPSNFGIEGVAIENQSAFACLVSVGSTPPVFAPGGYDFLVPASSVLVARVPSTKHVFVLPFGAPVGEPNTSVEVFTFAGPLASLMPAHSLVKVGRTGAPTAATGGVTSVAGMTDFSFAPSADPFASATTRFIDSILVTASAAGTYTLIFPVGASFFGIPFIAAGAGELVIPMYGAAAGAPSATNPFQNTKLNADVAGTQVGATIIYR